MQRDAHRYICGHGSQRERHPTVLCRLLEAHVLDEVKRRASRERLRLGFVAACAARFPAMHWRAEWRGRDLVAASAEGSFRTLSDEVDEVMLRELFVSTVSRVNVWSGFDEETGEKVSLAARTEIEFLR
jgi:hypothetical protein